MASKSSVSKTRNTQTREAILAAFVSETRPLSPEEILKFAQRNKAGLGIATVYRSIRFFLENKQITEVKVPGEVSRYELAGKSHHHHFHCNRCDRLFEVTGCPKDLKKIMPRGFILQSHELTLYGLCNECK